MVQSVGLCGNGFSLHDGGIAINESGIYMIAGSIYCNAFRNISCIGGMVQKSVHIMNQNNIELVSASDNAYIDNGNDGDGILYGAISTAPKIVNLSTGDIIYLYGRMSMLNGSMSTGNSATYLTIIRLC